MIPFWFPWLQLRPSHELGSVLKVVSLCWALSARLWAHSLDFCPQVLFSRLLLLKIILSLFLVDSGVTYQIIIYLCMAKTLSLALLSSIPFFLGEESPILWSLGEGWLLTPTFPSRLLLWKFMRPMACPSDACYWDSEIWVTGTKAEGNWKVNYIRGCGSLVAFGPKWHYSMTLAGYLAALPLGLLWFPVKLPPLGTKHGDRDRKKMSTEHLELGLVLCINSVNNMIYTQNRCKQMAVLRRNSETGEPGCFLTLFYVGDIIICAEIFRILRTPDLEISKFNHKIVFQYKIHSFYNSNHLDYFR